MLSVETLGRVDSTQGVMRSRLESGLPVDGTVVRALEQTAGRGRRGTEWASAPGGSYQTAAFRWSPPQDRLAEDVPEQTFLSLAIGWGIAHTLARLGEPVAVKWPNDLMLGERKLGGVLTERARGHLLVGVGLNVANPVPDTYAALSGRDPTVVSELVLEGVIAGLGLMSGDAATAVAAFASCDWLAGRAVAIESATGRVEGLGCGVDARGRLLLGPSDGAGPMQHVLHGHVVSVGPR